MNARSLPFALSLALFAGCADHEARGDSHWQRREYAAALEAWGRVPPGKGSPDLSRKMEQARQALSEDQLAVATRALEAGQFEAAIQAARAGREVREDERLARIENEARVRLVSRSIELGRLHLQRGEVDAAIREFETAHRHDPSAETKRLLLDAKATGAARLADEARRLAAAREWDRAMETARRAVLLDERPESRAILAEIENARGAWEAERHAALVAEGRQLLDAGDWGRAAAKFEGALQLRRQEPAAGLLRCARAMAAGEAALARGDLPAALGAFGEADGTGHAGVAARGRLEEIERRRAALLEEAGAKIASREWGAAQEALGRAAAIRSDPEVERLRGYAGAMAAGEAALARKDFTEAARRFAEAASAGVDDGGHAAARRDGLTPAVWRVTVATVLVLPLKADESVWDGSLTKALPLETLMGAYAEGVPPKSSAKVAATIVPEANRPDPYLVIALPDGRRFRTRPAGGTFLLEPRLWFTVEGHLASEEAVTLTVADDDSGEPGASGDDPIGALTIRVGELLSRGERSAWQSGRVHALEVAAERLGKEAFAGAVQGAEEITPPPGPDVRDRSPVDPPPPPPPPSLVRFDLRLRRVRIAAGDFQVERGEGAPDPQVEVLKGDERVFLGEVVKDAGDKKWPGDDAPAFVVLLAPGEELTVRLYDHDPKDPDLALSATVTAKDLDKGRAALKSPRGSLVEIEVKR
ncbi:MAG: hypothetical protein L0216_15705 [Planctomycetales bacterium]|nr:hypothetical protein [Planctomycetales bacterium]